MLFSTSLLVSFTSIGQKPEPYTVNSTIGKTVEENIKLTLIPSSSAIKSTETINDSAYSENFGIGQNMGAITQASLSHDTIFITSFLMATDASYGYKIILTNESCIIKYFSLTDDRSLKVKITDKPSNSITVVCQTAGLTFLKRPKFKVDELLEGIVELTTPDYYSFQNGHDTKINMKVTGYFKEKLVKYRPDIKDVFKQIH